MADTEKRTAAGAEENTEVAATPKADKKQKKEEKRAVRNYSVKEKAV